MNMLKTLRDAAKDCQHQPTAEALQIAADNLMVLIAKLKDDPEDKWLMLVNSQWAYALRLWSEADGNCGPSGSGGAGLREEARLAA